MSAKFSPNATPEPIVSKATVVVNRCGVTSSSVASRLTSTTATIASGMPATANTPGRSPMAMPTPTGTAAVSTAVSGETTEQHHSEWVGHQHDPQGGHSPRGDTADEVADAEADRRQQSQRDADQMAAIMLTDTAAKTIPRACQRVTRSRSTMMARMTVVAGYSEIKTLANDSSHF